MSYPYMIQGKNLVIVADGKPYMVTPAHEMYNEIKLAISTNSWDEVARLCNFSAVVMEYTNGDVSISDGVLMWRGTPIHNTLAKRIIAMRKEGFPFEPMIRFLHNLMANPSKRAIAELYDFLEAGNLPITEDGHFLAYKRVTNNFKDCYTKTIDNSIGRTVTMPRERVVDDKYQTCSAGLHFCALSYLSSFGSSGDRTVSVKINPADVVSIPVDYQNAKGRCCKYVVLAELTGDLKNAFPTIVAGVTPNNTSTAAAEYASKTNQLAPKTETKPAATTPTKPGLSMDPSAVRKREKRAAEKAAREAALVEKAAAEKAAAIQKTAAAVQKVAKAALATTKSGLSMDPAAVRKREKRAAEKAAREAAAAAALAPPPVVPVAPTKPGLSMTPSAIRKREKRAAEKAKRG